jgi:hypothetical protein
MKPATYKEVVELANSTDAKLTAYEFHPTDLVFIIHEEGTTLTFRSAFLREWKDWVIIFTEHHGTHVYSKGDLSYWGHYSEKEKEKLKGTGFIDACEFCGKTGYVEDLIYGLNPNWEQDDNSYHSYCEDCRDVEASEHRDLWRWLNQSGAFNQEKGHSEPWGFTWGRDNIDHVKKALATVIQEEGIEAWLDTPSPAFKKTPRHAIEEGDIDEVYLMAYQMGTGAFL